MHDTAENTLTAIGGASPLPFLVVDEAGFVCTWNTAAEILLGLSAEDAVGRPVPASLGNALERRDGAEVEWTDGEGRELQLLVSATPLEDGSIAAFALPVRSLNGAAAGLVHEFNNVMMAISGFTELLLTRAATDSDRRYLNHVQDAAARGSQVARTLASIVRRS
jgi:PAS domain S-box-containing protein